MAQRRAREAIHDFADPGRSKVALAYRELKRSIVAGELPPGAAIDKSELCVSLGVSRLTMTVAINRLAHEELVVVAPQRGSYVAPIRPDEVRQLMRLRIALEAEAASALAEGPGRPRFLAFAHRSLAYQRAALEVKDLERFYELDVELHREMIAESELPKFNDALDPMRAHLDRVRRLMQTIPGRVYGTLAEHEQLVAGIASGDPARAAHGLRAHLESAMTYFVTVANEQQAEITTAE